MANQEHLEILNQGVEVWNKWRARNRDIEPELEYAYLGWRNLHGANLSMADLNGAKLMGVLLGGADLCGAKLSLAVLRGANLCGAKAIGADFRGRKRLSTDLRGTDLSWGDFSEANLWGGDLRRADLTGAKFEEADLTDADLSFCSLVETNLSGAVLTGTKLYGTARDHWVINDVKCEYVYWDEEARQKCPKDRNLQPGEFERLYAALPTIEYVFEKGMTPIDPLIMDRVVQAIQKKRPEFGIKVDSINARGLAPSIKFIVNQEEHRELALDAVTKLYEERLERLGIEAQRDVLYSLLARKIDAPNEVKLITAGPGAIVATNGSTVNIQQHINNAVELQKAVADQPQNSKIFAKVAKKTALNILGEALKDFAKGQVKEAAKQIVELGKDLGPVIVNTAAYAFFKSILG